MEVFIDIETIPEQPEDEARAAIAETIQAPATMSKAETIAEWHAGGGKYAGVKDTAIDEQYRKTSLNGAKGEIASISWAFDDDEPPYHVIRDGGDLTEEFILQAFFDSLKDTLGETRPYFVGHYIGGFDLPFIFQRAVINRVKPPFSLSQHGRHDQHFFDNMMAWAGFRGTISQENLCKALGIEIEGPEGLEGSNVWDAYKAGKLDEIAEYNKSDVAKAREIYRRLTFK